jgi:Rieske Fe-S protein
MADRRSVLKVICGAIASAIGIAIAVPAAALLSSPARRRARSGGDEPVDVGALATLKEGQPVRVAVKVKRRLDAWTAFTGVTLGAAWLTRSGEKVCALSTVCPHAGCAVDWEPSENRFRCPCHGSVFSPDGQAISGPTPRAMDSLDTQVKGGRVLLRWRRFRQGVSGKEET